MSRLKVCLSCIYIATWVDLRIPVPSSHANVSLNARKSLNRPDGFMLPNMVVMDWTPLIVQMTVLASCRRLPFRV